MVVSSTSMNAPNVTTTATSHLLWLGCHSRLLAAPLAAASLT